MLKWDGHTHTKFCYHGSDAETEQYIERAIELGFERYTISEHPPLPQGWVQQESLFQELAMPMSELSDYFSYVQAMKDKYRDQIEITIGLELDYLQGNETFTQKLVESWGHLLEDVVYSVHFLPGKEGMHCVDFTADDFKHNLLAHYGSIDKVIDVYYDHIEQTIIAAGKLPMRTRIGHINLIRKFETELPPFSEQKINERLEQLIPLLAQHQVGVDVNIAGLRVATCNQAYVPEWFIKQCMELDIPCIYGSDAHKPEQVGLFFEWYEQAIGQKK